MNQQSFYFFLSYAREDRDRDRGGAIQAFHRDLVEAVRVRTNWPNDRVGFLETTAIAPGSIWPKQLPEELAMCRAFVPILSRTYFDRTFCGQEWAVFSKRLASFEAESGARAPLIQPVQFVAPEYLDGMPAVVTSIQRTHDTYPSEFNRAGLLQLFRLHQNSQEYPKFVNAFADLLVAAVNEHQLPPSPVIPDITKVVSAFQHPGTHLIATDPQAKPSGPRFAQFFFVAASRGELVGVRQELQFYGDEGGLDWQPYLPDLTDEVAIIAQEVASREKLRYESLPLNEHFIESIEEAVQLNKIVVVLVDSWTVRLQRYKELMERLDGRDFDNCIVVVPWNTADPETRDSRDVLRQAIQATFIRKARRRDPESFVDTTNSHDEFKQELGKSLVAARARILENRDVIRRAEIGGVFVDPALVAAPPSL